MERRRQTIPVASLIYPLAAAAAGTACRTDFVDSVERLPTRKALARTQATRIVCLSAI